MKTWMTRLILLVLVVGALGCASTGGSPTGPTIAPESLGPFDCADRGAVASPPPREVLDLGQVQGDAKKVLRKERDPLLTIRLCKDGQVPVSRTPAKGTVAKGNPLIRPLDRPLSDFFEKREGVGALIRQNLFPFEKVYYIPPGPDDKPHDVPPDPPGCNGYSYFGSCYYYGPASFASAADGGGMTMRIERPDFHGTGHSLDEISVQGGTGNGNIVELGWNVSTSQYPDADPHLFVFHWIDWTPTCYDTCGWHQYSATYFPGMNLGPLVGRDAYVGYVFYQGNWWAWFDNQWLGYFPGSEWSGSFTQSSMIQWFGEVATSNGIPPGVEMGNGLFPTDPGAAPNATLCDVDARAWVCWIRDMQSLGPNYPPYYDIRRTGFGHTRYGGPGL
jgi:hypothetical protein